MKERESLPHSSGQTEDANPSFGFQRATHDGSGQDKANYEICNAAMGKLPLESSTLLVNSSSSNVLKRPRTIAGRKRKEYPSKETLGELF